MHDSVNSLNSAVQQSDRLHQKLVITDRRIGQTKRRFILTINFVSALACVFAVHQLFAGKVGLMELTILFATHFLIIIGITVGFHRYFSHKTFQTSTPIRVGLAILGSMAAHGPVISWVATHRCHHQFSDRNGDPHSPYAPLTGVQGFWHAHLGWLLNDQLPNSAYFAKDLLRDRAINFVNRHYLVWVLLGLLLPAVICGLLTRSISGAFQGLIWGGLVRLFLSFHGTCSINSIAHVWGQRRFNTSDHSRNNWPLALFMAGEGWHHNHHTFPNSATFRIAWWQFDLGGVTIWILEQLGLVWQVNRPSAAVIQQKANATEQ